MGVSIKRPWPGCRPAGSQAMNRTGLLPSARCVLLIHESPWNASFICAANLSMKSITFAALNGLVTGRNPTDFAPVSFRYAHPSDGFSVVHVPAKLGLVRRFHRHRFGRRLKRTWSHICHNTLANLASCCCDRRQRRGRPNQRDNGDVEHRKLFHNAFNVRPPHLAQNNCNKKSRPSREGRPLCEFIIRLSGHKRS
jgi:hypothetical protein